MPIDTRLITQAGQMPDMGEAMQKGMQLRSMYRQNKKAAESDMEDQSIKDAIQKATVTNPDGTTTIDKKGALGSIYKANPMKGMEMESKFNEMDAQEQTRKSKMTRELIWSINDDSTYQAARERGIQMGLPNADKLPPVWDQKTQQLVKNWQQATLTPDEKIAQQNAREARADRNADRADARDDRFALARERQAQKIEERDEKKKTSMAEVTDRQTLINDNLDALDKMIEDKGTWELTGSHNQDLERLVDTVATDMAKLQDPSSVARPSEVEAVKKNLVASGFGNSNSTARKILKNFRAEVNRRAETAYKVRGLQAPTMAKQAPIDDQLNSLNDADLDRLYNEAQRKKMGSR